MLRLILTGLLVCTFCHGQCTPPAINLYVAADGDSITLGADTPNIPYLTDLAALLTTTGVTVTTLNNGVSGISWNYAWPSTMPPNACTMIACAPTLIDPSLALSGYKTKWLILFAGTNGMNSSLGNHSPQLEFSNFEQYYAARIAAGWKPWQIIVCTMLPRGTGEETARSIYNPLLVQAAGWFGYNLARFDLDPNMGQANDNTNLTYYLSDQVHPNNFGQTVLAGILNNVIANLIGTPGPFCASAGTRSKSVLRTGTIR